MIMIVLQEKDKLEDIFGADSSDEEDAKGEAAAAPVRPRPRSLTPRRPTLFCRAPRADR